MDYYENYMVRYLSAPEKTRKSSKAHWIKCHKENIKSKRDDLIIFTAKILASIELAEAILNEKVKEA